MDEQKIFQVILVAALLQQEEETSELGGFFYPGNYSARILRETLEIEHPFKRDEYPVVFQSMNYIDTPTTPTIDFQTPIYVDYRDVRWSFSAEDGLYIQSRPTKKEVLFDFTTDWKAWLSEDGRLDRLKKTTLPGAEGEEEWMLRLIEGIYREDFPPNEVLVVWPVETKFEWYA